MDGVEINTVTSLDNGREKDNASAGQLSQSVSKKKKAGARVSVVWDHFTKDGTSGSGDPKASCNYCGQQYCCDPKTNGTSSMLHHLNKCKKYPYKEVEKKQRCLVIQPNKWMENDSPLIKGEENGTSHVATTFSQEACTRALTYMILVEGLPFDLVEGQGLRHYSQILQPQFVVPSSMTVARDCLKLYAEEKAKLKKVFKRSAQRVCLTTNTWTSAQNLNYVCVTAHFIDDNWNLNKRVINFCQVPNDKGETIGKVLESCMLEWLLEKVLTITIDDSRYSGSAIRYLKTVIKDWDAVLENEFLQMHCLAHTLSLVVQDGLDDIHDSVVKIRNAVRYVRSSSSRLQKFRNCVEKLKLPTDIVLCLDIPNRWDSTYLMLEAAEKLHKAFELLKEDPDYVCYFGDDGNGGKISGPPMWEDCENIGCFLKFLKLFYDVTLKISGSSCSTLNEFFHLLVEIQGELEELHSSRDKHLHTMAGKIKRKCETFWGNEVNFFVYVAIVLDPRFKLDYVKCCFKEIYGESKGYEMLMKVKAFLGRLFDFYSNHVLGLSMETETPSAIIARKELQVKGCSFPVLRRIQSQFRRYVQEVDSLNNRPELEKYLGEGTLNVPSDVGFDILGWWGANCHNYVVLSAMARDILAIPISTAASDSAFHVGRCIIDPFQSSLGPNTLTAIVCAQNWLHLPPAVDIQQPFKEAKRYEKIELELMGLLVGDVSSSSSMVEA